MVSKKSSKKNLMNAEKISNLFKDDVKIKDKKTLLKIKSLINGPLKELANKVMQLYSVFIVDPFIVPMKEGAGINPVLYNPKNYDMKFIPKVSLTLDAKTREQVERQTDLETYQILIQDPTNNLEEIKKLYLPKITGLDKDQVKRVVETKEAPVTEEVIPQ